jgi:hypothetical protein
VVVRSRAKRARERTSPSMPGGGRRIVKDCARQGQLEQVTGAKVEEMSYRYTGALTTVGAASTKIER